MKKVIIFDMDGTLVDSSVTIVNAINHVRSNLKLSPLKKDLILEKVNDPHLNPAHFFYEVDEFTPQHESWFSEYYTNYHEEELELYKDIKELLKNLKDKGFKLAVATNAYRGSTIQSLSHLKILDYFETLVCYDDVDKGKPAPDMLQKVLEVLNIKINDALFIGDSERDMLASKSASIDYIMINWGFSDYADAIHEVNELEKVIINA